MKIDELINKLTDLKAVNGNIDVFVEYDGYAVYSINFKIQSPVTAKKDNVSIDPLNVDWEQKNFPD